MWCGRSRTRSVWSAWSLLPLSDRPTPCDSASKLDALQTLRVTPIPSFPYVSVFGTAHANGTREVGSAEQSAKQEITAWLHVWIPAGSLIADSRWLTRLPKFFRFLSRHKPVRIPENQLRRVRFLHSIRHAGAGSAQIGVAGKSVPLFHHRLTTTNANTRMHSSTISTTISNSASGYYALLTAATARTQAGPGQPGLVSSSRFRPSVAGTFR